MPAGSLLIHPTSRLVGMCLVGLDPSDVAVEVGVAVDKDFAFDDVVIADVAVGDFVAVVDDNVAIVGLLSVLSLLSTTISTLTFTGLSCIFTLFRVSLSSSSMVQMMSYCSGSMVFVPDSGIDPGSVAAVLSVVVVCSVADSVVVVASLVPPGVVLSAAVVVSVLA